MAPLSVMLSGALASDRRSAVTRMAITGSVGKGLLGTLMKLFEGKLQKQMETDFRGHLEDLREALGNTCEPSSPDLPA